MKLYSLKEGLKRARKEAGLTQAELTKILKSKGMVGHIKTIMNWEQGISCPTLDTLIELSKLYDCDLDYLTGRIECKTHDLQFIHEQTGLSEKAITKLQEFVTEPNWDDVRKEIKESNPKETEDEVSYMVRRLKEDWDNSIQRDYHDMLSFLIEHTNADYILSLITRRIKGYKPRSMDRPPTPKELTQDDLWIEIDGQEILANKRNMLDSLITSEITYIIQVISEEYHAADK